MDDGTTMHSAPASVAISSELFFRIENWQSFKTAERVLEKGNRTAMIPSIIEVSIPEPGRLAIVKA